MNNETNTAFVITGWNEEPVHETDGGKISRAKVSVTYVGAITGDGTCEYTMAYRPDGTAEFFGYELVSGEVGGKKGSFIIDHKGAFQDGKATDHMTIVPGTGSGELKGINGNAGYSVMHGGEYRMWFEYTIQPKESETGEHSA